MVQNPIKIKGYPNGLIITYSAELTYEEIKEVTKEKFSSSRKFFGSNPVCIIFRGVLLIDEEEDELCRIIEDNSDIKVVCVMRENGMELSLFNESLRMVADEQDKNDVYYINRSLINEEFIKSEKDIIVIGDVNPGCSVISSKNIHIFGGAYGTVIAGYANESYENNYVTAIDMSPELLRIGNIECINDKKSSKWGIKAKLSPAVAYIKDDRIQIDNYNKDLMDRMR